MDWQQIFNTVVPVGAMLISGWVGTVHYRLNKTTDDLTALRLKVAEEYVTHTDLSDIKSMLRRIEDKLDGKADK